MKIGILYICTGKYNIFWKDFYLTCEKNFILDSEKHYFVFTDSEGIEFENDNPRIHKIYQENLGWPFNTLKRYQIFLKSKEMLERMDYLFYLNANLLFLENISKEEFLPLKNETLVGCLHPGYYNKSPNKLNYERRSKSKAFIKIGDGKYYFAGGINGGKTQDFLKTIETLDKNIEIDIKNKIIAKWHDESHWNWYLNNHLEEIKIINSAYLYPENKIIPFEKKILIIDKTSLGGHSKLRNKNDFRLFFYAIKTIISNNVLKFILKAAIISILLSVSTIFIKKWNILGLPIKISDVFLLFSIFCSVILLFYNKIKLKSINKEISYLLILFIILISGTLTSLLIFKGLPYKEVILVYLRTFGCFAIFTQILIYEQYDSNFIKYIILSFLPSLIVIPITHLSPQLITNGLLLDSSHFRFAGLFNDPNYYANFGIFPTSILLYLFLKEKNLFKKIFLFLLVSLSTGFLIWAGSRSGILGLAVSFLLFVFFEFKFNGFNKSLFAIFYIICSILIGLLFLPSVGMEQIKSRVQVFYSPQGRITLNQGQGRESLWKQSYNYIIKNPIGYGPGYSSIIEIRGVGDTENRVSHSIIFETILIGGLPIIIYFVYLFIGETNILLKNNFKNYILICGLAGILASALFIDSFESKWIWVIVAVIIITQKKNINIFKKDF